MFSAHDFNARYRTPLTDDEALGLLRGGNPPEQQERRRRTPERSRAIIPSYPLPSRWLAPDLSRFQGHPLFQGQPHLRDQQAPAPTQRWEQVPPGIRLMNEICDATTIGSDFAFWTGLIIIVVVLVGLMVRYSD